MKSLAGTASVPIAAACAALTSSLAILLAAAAPAPAAIATIDETNGYIVVDGEPFFPIGVYHVSWIGDRQGEEAVPDLHLAADAGFNLIHPTVDGRDDMIELFDAAAERDMLVIGETPWPEGGAAPFINEWKSHSSIVGWNIADDFNTPYAGPAYNHPPAQVSQRNDHVHATAPSHFTYMSGGSYPGFRIAEFAGLVDVMGFQSYPIGAQNNPDDYALEEHMESVDWIADQLEGTGQVWVINPQAYRWDDGGRYPTPSEARNMLYGSLTRGTRGVIWYAMWEGAARYLPGGAPSLWADLRRTNAEVASLAPFLLHGTRTMADPMQDRVYAAHWEHDGQILVVVLSTERTESHDVTIDLPDGTSAPATAMFPSRSEGGMSVTGGQLVGTIGPEEVHVYLIDVPVAGNASPTAAFDVIDGPAAYGAAVTLDASASSDADGSIVSYEWDFGDGTSGSGVQPSHTWSAPGSYDVRLTVRDDDGATGTSIVTVDVGVTSLCPATPRPDCTAAQATIVLRDKGGTSRRSLLYKWSRAAATPGDVGDPTAATEYALCLYETSALAVATSVKPGSGWTALGTTSFRYSGAASKPGGVATARVQLRDGSAGGIFKGKGIALPDLSLPLDLPVRARVVAGDTSACWESTFASGGATRSTAALFRARSQ